MAKLAKVLTTTGNPYRPSYVPNLDGVGDVMPSQVEVSTFPPALVGRRRLACAVIEDALRCAGLSIEKPVLNTGGTSWRYLRANRTRYRDAMAYLIGEQPHVALPIDVAC